jgi:hypothetical protein
MLWHRRGKAFMVERVIFGVCSTLIRWKGKAYAIIFYMVHVETSEELKLDSRTVARWLRSMSCPCWVSHTAPDTQMVTFKAILSDRC